MTGEIDKTNWRPLRQSDLTQAFVDEFHREEPDTSVISAWFAAKFHEQTGLVADRSNPAVDNVYAKWLVHQELVSEIPFHIRRWPRLNHLVYVSYSSKISSLGQRYCHICSPSGSPHIMPIRITPRSRQNINSFDRQAFHRAIQHWACERALGVDLTQKLCIALTFVLDSKGTDKDLDNMVKLLQDAIAGAFKFNDRDVHHLDLLKLIMPVEEEYVYFRIMSTGINEHQDVLAPVMNHVFAVGPALNLEDFVE